MKPIPHLPYVGEFDGLLDIFTICNIMEASNILHYKTYRRGTEGLTAADRRRMIHGRITARQILTWIFSNYAFEGDVSMEVFYWRYLAHQLKTLCQIKERVEWQDINTFDCNSIAKEVKKKFNRRLLEWVHFKKPGRTFLKMKFWRVKFLKWAIRIMRMRCLLPSQDMLGSFNGR
jgi:hypothetical protein